MTVLGYHASHEQFAPSALVQYAILAEQAGFKAIHSSDHFYPWSVRQGHSGYTFAWLGAAMQATKLPFSAICTPGQRYHPAIVAQAVATLAEMFPGRFAVELASGEALNERITGQPWPSKPERNKRLQECGHIIRSLLQGDEVTHNGSVTVQEARLYTLPAVQPLLICAAITPQTAAWAGSWADGLITVGTSADKAAEIINAFNRGGGSGKPVFLKLDLSYASTRAAALEGAYHQWRTNILAPELLGNIYKPEHFDQLAASVQPADVEEKVKITADAQECIDWLHSFAPLKADRLILHNVNRMQEQFIEDFGEKVLPFVQLS